MEDLVFHPIRDHVDEAAQVVRSREPGESPLAALHRRFMAGLASGDPNTGLADYPEFLDFQRMVTRTPSLKLRLMEQWVRSEDSLAQALAEALGVAPDGVVPRVLACQVVATQRTLTVRNVERMLAGERPADVLARCAAEADEGFGLLEKALP